ncbi:MAG TPA: fused MFS/spermidine synthase [Vicinamibacterales bacterium]|nr:fused MFS/spermidine synthase [Vicinamibacterales bacterium]
MDASGTVSTLNSLSAAAPLARQRSRVLVVTFTTTLFVSAFLMFLVEPMIARMVLPLLGGAAAVWNTCLVFFQAVLLCGYAYAHGATTLLGARRHPLVHMGVMLAPVLCLPIALWSVSPPPTTNPAGWLLLTLLLSIGLPFFALSTSAAVLQQWYSSTGEEGSRDPYFLYSASNLGSFAALVAYPLVVERTLRLEEQARLWTVGYVVLVLLTLACAAAVWRRARATAPIVSRAPELAPRAESIAWSRRARWTVLAFVPSSLLMAVTSYMSTDVASVPLLWMVPLGVYLATFIVAFSPGRAAARAGAARFMPLAVIALALVLIAQMNQPATVVIPLHLLAFAVIALACHGDLFVDRPGSSRLTEFYFWISFGGMLGGLFNALLAPVLFTGIVEYPLVLVVACLARRAQTGVNPASWPRDLAWGAAVGAVAIVSVVVNGQFGSSSRFLILGAAVPALLAFGQQRRPLRFTACIAALLLSGALVQSPFGHAVYAERTFFGVYRVRVDDRLQYRFMFHGPTLHGMQSMRPERRAESLSYFQKSGPIGQVFDAVPIASAASDVGVVGLGVGSLASYAGSAQRWTFFEIDPAVERIARDRTFFTYLEDCGGRCTVTIGDARVSLARTRTAQFGVIILDAFSSDAIPVHLLTKEALSLYLSRLAPGGVIALHISNLHLSLSPVLGRLAEAQGLAVLWQREPATAGSLTTGKFPSEWMVMARDRSDLGALTRDPRWKPPVVPASTPLWTDDFSNILSVLRTEH